jgi:hypothetical protein
VSLKELVYAKEIAAVYGATLQLLHVIKPSILLFT